LPQAKDRSRLFGVEKKETRACTCPFFAEKHRAIRPGAPIKQSMLAMGFLIGRSGADEGSD
jgi:hypothetical protein